MDSSFKKRDGQDEIEYDPPGAQLKDPSRTMNTPLSTTRDSFGLPHPCRYNALELADAYLIRLFFHLQLYF